GALGAVPRYRKPELIAQTQNLLAVESAERHRKVIVILDEAHLLTPDQLEELRLLTSADMDTTNPFAGILVGQPALAQQLRMGTFTALDQRIAIRYTLTPMDLGESAQYLRHHLTLVGRSDPLFADDAGRSSPPGRQRPPPPSQQRRHRRPHRRRRRGQGSGRRPLRQARCRRAHP
ncbi:AAA ATPase, partial [mine drainage metagenome]